MNLMMMKKGGTGLNQFKNNKRNDRKISDIYTGDETEREDFGTQWTDWSNNPEDYLE